MKYSQEFSFKKRLQSFKHALNGLRYLMLEEHNARIHLLVAFLSILLSFLLKIEAWEWVAIVFSIGFVIIAEIINSAIENICDFVSPKKHSQIKKIKDLAAGAVLFASFASFTAGAFVFIPKLILLIKL